MRPGARPCTEAHARQDRSGPAAAHRPPAMSRPGAPHGPTIATALASAFLAGEWEPAAMGRRAKRALGDRRHWPTRLAEEVRAGYPERPADRRRELARFVEACPSFQEALRDR